MRKKIIPAKLYRKFVENMPLCCVDLVVENKDRFLLVKRKSNPEKGKWWPPGGRVFFGEKLVSASKRKLKEELGIKKAKSIRFLGVEEALFEKGYFGGPIYSINSVFLVKIGNSQADRIKLDFKNHLDYKWFRKIPRDTHPYPKRFLKLAGFK